jgi:phosphoenolpyruvate-protein kinase (PTS system EI component)
MFPSINDAEEFQQALDIFYSEMRGLVRMGVSLNEKIAVGSMIETPSAVFSAEHLAQVASFFSIGTNDLTQSFLGIGRRSSLIGHGFDEAHPVIIRAIRDTCRVAKDRGIPVSVCGDAASDSLLAPLLLGAGVRIFSVAEPNAGQVNHLVGHCEVLECERLVSQIIDDAPGVAKSRALLSEYLGTLRKRAGLE